MNSIVQFAKSLNVDFRCSQFGISILGNNTAKFFDINAIFIDDSDVKSYIKQCSHPSLQTKLITEL